MGSAEFTWKNLFESLWFFLDGNRARMVFWNIVNFIAHGNSIIIPLIVGLIINFFTTYSVGDSLVKFYWYCGLIAVSSVGLSVLRLTAKKKISGMEVNLRHDVRVKGFQRLMLLSLKWHDKENTGSKIEKISSGSKSLKDIVQINKDQFARIVLNFIGVLGVLAIINYRFLVFFAFYILLFALIEVQFNKKNVVLIDRRNRAKEKASGIYFDSASNILSIKSLGAQKSLARNIAKGEGRTRNVSLEMRNLRNSRMQFIQVLNGIALTCYFLLVGNGVVTSTITIGFIATAFAYFNTIKDSMFRATDLVPKLIEHKFIVGRLMPIFNTKEEKYFGNGKFPKGWEKISFQNSTFSYGKDRNLKDVNLNILRKEKLGIVGHSGSGKSTLGKILLGLYKLDKGKIKIDGKDFYSIKHGEVLNNISTVMQEVELFNISLKENVTLMKKVDKKLFEKAVRIAQLEPIIKKLPEGVNTMIGEKGYKLSGGERQRIGIARAICRGTDILILDEATSALDSNTESRIEKGIETLTEKTVLVIAHRLSTLKNVDKIIVFDNGKIIEQGSFKELTKDKNSKFYKLWKEQWKK